MARWAVLREAIGAAAGAVTHAAWSTHAAWYHTYLQVTCNSLLPWRWGGGAGVFCVCGLQHPEKPTLLVPAQDIS